MPLRLLIYIKTAITKAAKNCIEAGILAEFLKSHASEVLNMLTTEWNIERAKVVWKQEAWEDGLEKGVNISAEIIKDLKNKVPVEKIAARYHVPADTIKQLQLALMI